MMCILATVFHYHIPCKSKSSTALASLQH